jgi:TRAP-type transport system periplasmic protein
VAPARRGELHAIRSNKARLRRPYLFATEQNAWRALDGPFGKKLAEDLRTKTGIRVLGWWESGGFKHFSSNRPLRSPADFAGLKIRALGPISTPLIETLMGSAVPIGFGDLHAALTTSLVDVQENSLSVFRLVRLQEVHKFILLSGHSYAVGVLGINNAFYIQLSPDERAAVDAAALKAIAFNRESSRRAEQEAIATLRTAGVEFIELTPVQSREFRQITQGPVIEWLKSQISVPGLIAETLSARQRGEISQRPRTRAERGTKGTGAILDRDGRRRRSNCDPTLCANRDLMHRRGRHLYSITSAARTRSVGARRGKVGDAQGSPGQCEGSGSRTVSNIEKSHRSWWLSVMHPPVQAKSEGSRTSRVAASPAAAGCTAIGNCNTVARWPSQRRVSSTTCPSGNSNAS